MNDMSEPKPDIDYRTSHLSKGEDYDVALATAPFDEYMARQEAAIVAALVDQLFPGRIPRYLDLACGTGRITAQVERKAGRSYGVDVSETMVARARRKCTATQFVITDLTRERLDIEPVDLTTAFRFFANAQPALQKGALDSLRGALRPGGYLILNNHQNSWSIRNLLLKASGQSPDGRLGYLALRCLLRRQGFCIVRTIGVGAWLVRAKVV